jgi:hypothetical protein
MQHLFCYEQLSTHATFSKFQDLIFIVLLQDPVESSNWTVCTMGDQWQYKMVLLPCWSTHTASSAIKSGVGMDKKEDNIVSSCVSLVYLCTTAYYQFS